MFVMNGLISPASVIVAIGSGGKSSLLAWAADEARSAGYRVALTTSTHLVAPQGWPVASSFEAYDAHNATLPERICFGKPAPAPGFPRKLSAPDTLDALIDTLTHVGYVVLIEADGSKRLPLKAHALYEPVYPTLPAHVRPTTICVVGMRGIGQPICQAVHRPELWQELTGKATTVTIDAIAQVLRAEQQRPNNPLTFDLLIANQLDDKKDLPLARSLASALDRDVWAGSIRARRLVQIAP